MYDDKDDVIAPLDKVANRIELPPVKLKRNVRYKKNIEALKYAKGTRSVVICLKGEIHTTNIQNRAIAEHLAYSFWNLTVRARNDVRDLDIANDVESVRLSTAFFQISVFLGGELGKSEYMIYVSQKTVNSQPEPKWRIQDVYVEEILPTELHVQRIDPVYKYQKALYGKTEKEEQMEKAIKKLQERTTAKKEMLQKATIIKNKSHAIRKNEVRDLDGTVVNDQRRPLKLTAKKLINPEKDLLGSQEKLYMMMRYKELPKIQEYPTEKKKHEEIPEKNRLTSQEEKRVKPKPLPTISSAISRHKGDTELSFQFPEEVTDTIGSDLTSSKKIKDRSMSVTINFE